MFLMKTSIASVALIAVSAQKSGNRDSGLDSAGLGRRYKDLKNIALNYMPDFDERKYWAYGCNCLILGDRPMSDPGLGKPVDELDSVCKAYKDCQRCVSMKYGDTCIGEMVRYKWKFAGKNKKDVVCTDKPNTCERSLCECDLKFSQEMPAHRDVFNEDYHLFWSTIGWNAEEDCYRGGGGPYEPECCGAPDGPMRLFNDATKDCCSDHSIKPEGTC